MLKGRTIIAPRRRRAHRKHSGKIAGQQRHSCHCNHRSPCVASNHAFARGAI